MYRVFSFSMLYQRKGGRMITEPDALDMIYQQSGYKSFILTKSWGEFKSLLKAFQAVRQVEPAYYQHYLYGTSIDGDQFIFDGVIIYDDDRPYLVFGTTKGGD